MKAIINISILLLHNLLFEHMLWIRHDKRAAIIRLVGASKLVVFYDLRNTLPNRLAALTESLAGNSVQLLSLSLLQVLQIELLLLSFDQGIPLSLDDALGLLEG